MIPRRSLVTGGVLGGVLGAMAGADDAAAAPNAAVAEDVSNETVARIASNIAALRTEVQNLRAFSEITSVREIQKTYLRSNGRFPDYIDVGVDIWFGVHDWHIRWQQPMTIGRDPQNRYTIMLNGTSLVLHPESEARYISLPYEAR